jgi:hypothetical protein
MNAYFDNLSDATDYATQQELAGYETTITNNGHVYTVERT